MNRKLFAGLAPLLGVTAFVAAPSAAQAAPHWYIKKLPVGPAHVTVATKGNLTLSALGASIKCKTVDSEEIWNPVGGAGEDLVTSFVLSGCKNKVASAACPKGPLEVKAEGFGWPSRLISTPAPGS